MISCHSNCLESKKLQVFWVHWKPSIISIIRNWWKAWFSDWLFIKSCLIDEISTKLTVKTARDCESLMNEMVWGFLWVSVQYVSLLVGSYTTDLDQTWLWTWIVNLKLECHLEVMLRILRQISINIYSALAKQREILSEHRESQCVCIICHRRRWIGDLRVINGGSIN